MDFDKFVTQQDVRIQQYHTDSGWFFDNRQHATAHLLWGQCHTEWDC